MTAHARILGGASVLLLPPPLHAATWTVGQSGNEDFLRLYDACAASEPGDSVLISPGYYDEWDHVITLELKPLNLIPDANEN